MDKEPGGPQSTGPQRVAHNLATEQQQQRNLKANQVEFKQLRLTSANEQKGKVYTGKRITTEMIYCGVGLDKMKKASKKLKEDSLHLTLKKCQKFCDIELHVLPYLSNHTLL